MIKKFVRTLFLSVLLVSSTLSFAGNSSSPVTEDVHLPNGSVNNESIYTPGLGEIMTLTQMRHTKLWFAGKADNWKLADYELYELKEGFDNAINFHPNRSKLIPKMTTTPLEQLNAAIFAKNSTGFKKAFVALTNSCNACHKATNFGFNVVIIPVTNPYTNQSFEIRH